MIAAQKVTFYDNVVSITYKYLGPAAERFVARQIRNHLDKEPELLKRHELPGLIDWFSLAMALLSDDEQVIQQFTRDLHELSGTY